MWRGSWKQRRRKRRRWLWRCRRRNSMPCCGGRARCWSSWTASHSTKVKVYLSDTYTLVDQFLFAEVLRDVSCEATWTVVGKLHLSRVTTECWH